MKEYDKDCLFVCLFVCLIDSRKCVKLFSEEVSWGEASIYGKAKWSSKYTFASFIVEFKVG